MAALDLSGRTFGRWTVLKRVERDKRGERWLCRCSCPSRTERAVVMRELTSGNSKSCGCLQREFASRRRGTANPSYRHGLSFTPVHDCWCHMKRRCNDPNDKSYKDYGGRGIKVCDRWLNSFDAFFADMGHRPSPQHSIDRINNDGDYEPGNCRWATRKEQNNNQRLHKRSHPKTTQATNLALNHPDATLEQIAAIAGVSRATAWNARKKLGLRRPTPQPQRDLVAKTILANPELSLSKVAKIANVSINTAWHARRELGNI